MRHFNERLQAMLNPLGEARVKKFGHVYSAGALQRSRDNLSLLRLRHRLASFWPTVPSPIGSPSRVQCSRNHNVGISWNHRTIADARLAGVRGGRLAGGYVLRLVVEFDVLNWNEPGPSPLVIMAPARVWLQGQAGLSLGLAQPETVQPFTVSQYASKRAVLFDLPLTQQAMETVERHRNGQGIALAVKLQAEVRYGAEVQIAWEDLTGNFNISQWVEALDQAGFGRTLLFEVPIPIESSGVGSVMELLEAARRHLASGHYPDVVAKCRMVLEGITQELGEGPALKTACDAIKRGRTALQREMAMRQAAIDYAHLAHHPTGLSPDEVFDRNAAQMMLGITAALVSSSMFRRAASLRQA